MLDYTTRLSSAQCDVVRGLNIGNICACVCVRGRYGTRVHMQTKVTEEH
jgi:hypothetical protein